MAEEITTDTTEEPKTEKVETTEESPFSALRSGLSDDKVRKHAERFNTFEDMAKSHLEGRQTISKGGMKPGENASEEEMLSFRKIWDIPEKSENYAFPVHEGVELSDSQKESIEKWKGVFHKGNVSNGLSKELIEHFQSDIQAEQEYRQTVIDDFVKQSDQELRDEWKGDFDKNHSFANVGAKEFLGADYDDARSLQTADGRMLLDHPIILRLFSKVGREMQESGLGEIMSDSSKADITSQIETAIANRNKAQSEGLRQEALKWDQIERDLYGKLDRSGPIVGTGGRIA